MTIFVKSTSSDITFYLCEYINISKFKNQEVDVWVVGHLVTQFQGQILRAAANNRVRGHASVCGYAPPLPLHRSICGGVDPLIYGRNPFRYK